MTLSLQKRRALQQCALPDGAFSMLAMDQRGSLIKMIDAANPDAVSFAQVGEVKRDVIGVLSPYASATLLDAEYGYPTCVASNALSGATGLILALEKSGYEGDPTERRTALLEDWSVEQIRKAGASGVKLLAYYRPDAPNAANQEELIAEVAAECTRWDLPFFLEPLHYSSDRNAKKVPNAERRRLVIDTAKRLVPLGVDVLKAEFPLDVSQTSDEAEWADACAELSDACAVPWVLLSAGVEYETFYRQLKVACENGASGMLCGRAIWKEGVGVSAADRSYFLHTTATQRLQGLGYLVRALARPFTDFYPSTEGNDLENWYTADTA
ncbi:MAG: tagatose 1,6-diphosphate aldolase [Caldilineaceae bacterium]|nr:tagatose 1,6-diphosphate aldolase [Caldilineaceae bacterium]